MCNADKPAPQQPKASANSHADKDARAFTKDQAPRLVAVSIIDEMLLREFNGVSGLRFADSVSFSMI